MAGMLKRSLTLSGQDKLPMIAKGVGGSVDAMTGMDFNDPGNGRSTIPAGTP